MPGKNKPVNKKVVVGKNSSWYIFLIIIILVALIGVVYFSHKPKTSTQTTDAVNNIIKDEPSLGNSNASLVIVEFSDFQCPYCRIFETETFPYLKANAIDTGKVYFVYKDFPLVNSHPMALPTAEIMNCVYNTSGSDAFWKFHNEINAQQNLLDSGSRTGKVSKTVEYTVNDLQNWAQGIGLDIKECINNKDAYLNETTVDFQEGVNLNISATPSFLFFNRNNGRVGILAGAYPWTDFQKAIAQISA